MAIILQPWWSTADVTEEERGTDAIHGDISSDKLIFSFTFTFFFFLFFFHGFELRCPFLFLHCLYSISAEKAYAVSAWVYTVLFFDFRCWNLNHNRISHPSMTHNIYVSILLVSFILGQQNARNVFHDVECGTHEHRF